MKSSRLFTLIGLCTIVVGCCIGYGVIAQTRPTTTTAPASQPTTQATTKPTVIFVSGWYATNDATHGDSLNSYIKSYWKSHYNIDLLMSVYDRDAEIKSLIPATGTVVLVGHSFGFDECVSVARAISPRKLKLVEIDGVPRNNPKPNYAGFDLPDNVTWSWCIYRTTRSDGKTPISNYFSGPIHSAAWPFKNVHYVPKYIAPENGGEAAEHGICVWDGTAAAAVKIAMEQ